MTFKVKTKGQIEGEKLLVPKLRFKEFKNEWNEITLKKLLSFKNGINGDKDSYGYGIKYISVGDILNNTYITYDKIRGLIDINDKTLKENSVEYGDMVFQRSSETFNDIGQANVYLDKKQIATFGGFVIRGKKIGNYNPLFFNYLLKSPCNRKKVIVKGAGAQHYNISQEELEKIKVNFTGEKEQVKIANLFYSLDKKIELQKQKIEALKIYKRGLIKKIFGDIKDNDSIRLKDLYHFAYGEGNTNPDNGGIYPVYGANGKIGGFNKYNAEYSVIIGHMGAYAGNVLFEENKHFVTYNGTIAIPKNIKILRPKFGYYMLLNTNLPRICAGSGIPFLSYEILNNIKVKLPDIEAQEKCEKVLDKTEAKIKLEKRKFKNLSQLKKSLLQQMFI